jgi:hypothetical protein
MFRDADRFSLRTDHIAAAAFANYFFTGEHDADSVRSQIHANDGSIPEVLHGHSTMHYTARFAACFPEYIDRDQIARYIREYSSHRNAASLFASAAIGEPVLFQLREAAAEVDSFNTNAQYLAAAFVAIGDDDGARELLSRFHIYGFFEYLPANETVNTLLFYIFTAINPELAWEYARRDYENFWISDTPERINFVRRVRMRGGNVSEFEYFLNGETHTARLENFQRLHLHITSEQLDALKFNARQRRHKFQFAFLQLRRIKLERRR